VKTFTYEAWYVRADTVSWDCPVWKKLKLKRPYVGERDLSRDDNFALVVEANTQWELIPIVDNFADVTLVINSWALDSETYERYKGMKGTYQESFEPFQEFDDESR
jgi:hypothetical protein